MRLIDADRMKTIHEIQMGDYNSIESIRRWIDRQPTVEAKKVVHGEWKNRAEYNDHLHCECSICGFTIENYRAIKTFGISSDDYIEVKWVYCPKCGASMRTSAE